MGRLRMVFLTLVIALASGVGIFNGYTSPTVYAAESKQAVYERQNILEDLTGSTIEGEAFNLAEYNFDRSKEMKLISFIEFCYSNNADKQADYGLYAYVYNPQGKAFKLYSKEHAISIRVGGNQSANFNSYRLTFLNQSMRAGYEGLFLKFRVELNDVQRRTILNKLNSSARIYEVGEIQLMREDNDFEVVAGGKYIYTGYVKGYGLNSTEENTLECKIEGGQLTLSLDVKSTAYRPDGSNGKNAFTQDSLHSVYFAVPNEIITKYGDMTQIHAKWLNATLKPGLVSGNREAYEKLLPIVAHQIPMSKISNYQSYGVDWKYAYLGAVRTSNIAGIKAYYDYGIRGNVSFNSMSGFWRDKIDGIGEELDELPILLYASNGNADCSRFESTEELLNYLKNFPNICPPELDPIGKKSQANVADKYPSFLFSKYDTEYTEKWVKSTETIKLENYKVDGKWWQKLLGLWELDRQPFEKFSAIQPVKASDLQGSTDEISKRLAVGKADIPAFMQFYEDNKADKTVFLFRFYQGEFIAQEATLYAYEKDLLGYEMRKKDSNAYFFQTDVNLNFDIIDITYQKGETVTTIPVVSKPVDIVPDPTPPIITMPDGEEFWQYGVGIIGGLLGVMLLTKIIEKGVR